MIVHFNGPLFEVGNNLVFKKCFFSGEGLPIYCSLPPWIILSLLGTEDILEKCTFFLTSVNINKFNIDNIPT